MGISDALRTHAGSPCRISVKTSASKAFIPLVQRHGLVDVFANLTETLIVAVFSRECRDASKRRLDEHQVAVQNSVLQDCLDFSQGFLTGCAVQTPPASQRELLQNARCLDE